MEEKCVHIGIATVTWPNRHIWCQKSNVCLFWFTHCSSLAAASSCFSVEKLWQNKNKFLPSSRNYMNSQLKMCRSNFCFSCPSQSPCVPCGAWQHQRSSRGSWSFSGSHWATTSPAATPTPCPCATVTPCQQGAAEGTMPPFESVFLWIATRRTSPWGTCRPSVRSMSGWHWPTLKARRRAEKSPSKLRKTVSGRLYFTYLGVDRTKEA